MFSRVCTEFKVKNARAVRVHLFAKHVHVVITNRKRKMANPVDCWQNGRQNQMRVYVFRTYFLCQGLETCNSSLLPR